MAVADYNKDGFLDIFMVTRQQTEQNGLGKESRLFKNNGDGTFTDVTQASGITSTHDYTDTDLVLNFGLKLGASWGDYDNDGFPDLFLASHQHHELYHNNGDGTFTNLTEVSGFESNNECFNSGATWFDFNNDSHLDIFITKYGECAKNRLFINNGDATFREVTSIVEAEANDMKSFMGLLLDIDNNGWLDLYVANDFIYPNELLTNQSGQSFEEEALSYGLSDFRDGMGLATADYNNDGQFEIYVTNINENSFFEKTGPGTYTNRAEDFEISDSGWAWGVQFGDFDHDGDEDLVVANGYILARTALEYNFYYQNLLMQGSEGFENQSQESGIGVELSMSNGVATFDYDNDGDLDILFSNTSETPYFYENDTQEKSQTGKQSWVKIELEGTTSNRDAIGTRVEVVANNTTMTRWYHGAGLYAQSLQPVHFGTSDADHLDKLTIKWPSGMVEEYENLPVNKTIYCLEGEGFEILADKPAKKVLGCTDSNSCSYNPEATLDDGSCTYLPAKSITGNRQPNITSIETYTYPNSEGGHYQWAVDNGNILSGQGTHSIDVEWGIHKNGKVSVKEFQDCSGEQVSLDISLSSNEFVKKHSVARLWNEVLLEAIRHDYAKPTVHARNLFHVSVALYDSWAIYHPNASPYLIGNKFPNFISQFQGMDTDVPTEEAIRQTLSYAVYKLLTHRFKKSPGSAGSLKSFDDTMELLGYDRDFSSNDYSNGDPRALGNYIAESLILYGQLDGSREGNFYDNAHYQPVNPVLRPNLPGNPAILYPNRWQPLQLNEYIDQAGNPVDDSAPAFLSPEWGNVSPFSLTHDQSREHKRDGNSYKVYFDPGAPPHLDINESTQSNELYQWNFALVSAWSAHLNPHDGVMWDISPKSLGNIDLSSLPKKFEAYPDFYHLKNGGDIGKGRPTNPITNQPYQEQLVPRGDYARVLAEFWADGPDSETPPGHWFVLLNYVSDHSDFNKRVEGKGEVVENLEWDVKSYFALGGAMHDAAISAWGIKGWYDYIRPISAIRYMAGLGQGSNPELGHFHPSGIPLIKDFIELVEEQDELAGEGDANVGKIKLYAWKGHDYIKNTSTDEAGVGWILAENWWPYQRPSFVTPPFAGYVSGHSTFSRAAAEVMTMLTGSEYFPGGMGEFVAKKNEFLIFEEGPSQDVALQWATYRDASDQCSLSRIWGGIHPPADDIPGRIVGEKIGKQAFELAKSYFQGKVLGISTSKAGLQAYPNPLKGSNVLTITGTYPGLGFTIYDLQGRTIPVRRANFNHSTRSTSLQLGELSRGIYLVSSVAGNLKLIVQ